MDKKIPETKKGLGRALRAATFSWQGFKEIVKEDAFKQELISFIILAPLACLLPVSLLFKLLMILSLLFIMLVEVLNSSIEAVVDLVSPGYNEFAKLAKDLGSLAVLMAIIMAVITWATALLSIRDSI